MSDLETRPQPHVGAAAGPDGPDEVLLTARRVVLGRTTEVSRVLPDRAISMIGPWCFLDHYGPEDVTATPGMRVWAHPHTGLQTVSWLFEGAVEHRDSLGSQALVRPGELNIMTAGRGVVHSELSPADKPAGLHGVQLWVALADPQRDGPARFEQFRDLPSVDRPGLHGTVLIGTVAGVASPAPGRPDLQARSSLCGADLTLEPGTELDLELDPVFEHGVFVVSGRAEVARTGAGLDQLVYLGPGRDHVGLRSDAGCRLLILGGEPFEEEIVMWWNFVGRSHDEVVASRAAWVARTDRFPAVADRSEKVMEAPPMPHVQLRPRPRRRRR